MTKPLPHDHHAVCKKHGLDPSKTSLLHSACLALGIDPNFTTEDELRCVLFGFRPDLSPPSGEDSGTWDYDGLGA